MELEFPSRLFGDGLEPQVKKINDRWRLGLLELVKEKNEARIRGSGERSLFLAYYGYQEEESEVFGEAGMTSRRHEKWFTFARRPLRFGLKEYHVVTGLKVKQEKNSGLDTWKDDDGFWSTQIKTYENINLQIIKKKYLVERNSWTWVDMARLIYLCVIMVGDSLEKLQNYPWGLYSFDFMLKQIDKTRDKLKQKEGYLMEEFLFGFQIWIMEAIPAFGDICGVKEATSSKFEEADKKEGEEGEDQAADTEIDENSHVAENVDGTTDVSGKNNRKHADRGA
ncbi:hypothetical protein BRARA_J00666 [Brassica rapa]|uniref:DUF1985 domain-containing protein n=1 Tax=Brassica campestris TaxID=3711 RepID=A0A397XMI0_BRACM|nr:hypothetical protein BRARA_J00666 [Brassica rapa]